jgi:hypothetical protein
MENSSAGTRKGNGAGHAGHKKGRELRPLAFHNRAHLIGDVVDALDLPHILMQPLEIGL